MPDAVKQDRRFYAPSVNAYYDYDASGIKWRRIARNHRNLVAGVPMLQKPFKVSNMASRRAAFSGNTSLFSTYSNLHLGYFEGIGLLQSYEIAF